MSLNEANLEKRFNQVSTSQGSIQSLSFFCLHYKNHHKKIAHIWLRCLQKAKVSHRLTLIYLANDIVQNAKRKNTLSFIDDFKSILKDTIPYLRDEKIKKSVERVFSIWQDRDVFDAKFTNELKNLLNDNGRKSTTTTPTKTNNGSVSSNSNTTLTDHHKTSLISHNNNIKTTNNDLIETLNKLSDYEKNEETIRSSSENIIDRITHATLNAEQLNDKKTLNELRDYIIQLKNEIDERTKLSKLLEESAQHHQKLLKDSEEQLIMYKSQLESIVKHREEISLNAKLEQ